MPQNCSWLCTFAVLFLFRYVRLWVNLASNWKYSPISPVDEPTVTSQDVTVIIPTVAGDLRQLQETFQSVQRLEPYEVILVAPDSNIKRVNRLFRDLGCLKSIRVLSIGQANKRRQLCRAIPEVKTKITLLLDDDVWLPEKFMEWLLAPFEDPRMGGVGTNQQLRRVDRNNIWEFLGAMYLVRRNFDCTACNWIDGGLPCLSGRAVAYRSKILQQREFTRGFTHETWGGGNFLNADDDNFITRWLFNKDWKIQIQNHPECVVETTLENDQKYLLQCLRWVRSNWRSNLTSLADKKMWRNYPWSIYAVFLTTITQWTFLFDISLLVTFYLTLSEAGYYDVGGEAQQQIVLWHEPFLWILFFAHFLFAKTIKLIPHLLRNPSDMSFIAVSILFGYFHNLIKLYGLITIRKTTWGTREGTNTDTSTTTPLEQDNETITYTRSEIR